MRVNCIVQIYEACTATTNPERRFSLFCDDFVIRRHCHGWLATNLFPVWQQRPKPNSQGALHISNLVRQAFAPGSKKVEAKCTKYFGGTPRFKARVGLSVVAFFGLSGRKKRLLPPIPYPKNPALIPNYQSATK